MQAGIYGIKIHTTFLTCHQILTTQKSIQFKNRSDIDQIFQKLPKASKMKYTLIETEMSKYIKMKQVVLASFSSFLKNNFQFACAETFLCLSKRQINTNFLLNVYYAHKQYIHISLYFFYQMQCIAFCEICIRL